MQWLATYSDGETLGQYNDSGEFSSEHIDRSRLESFALISEDGSTILQLHLEPGQRLIYRRRIEQSVGGPQNVCYLFGWQQTIHGQNVQSIWYVFEEGRRIELAGRFREGHPWFYPVELVDCEKEVPDVENNGSLHSDATRLDNGAGSDLGQPDSVEHGPKCSPDLGLRS